MTWIQILTLSMTSCAMLGNLIHLSVPRFSPLQNEMIRSVLVGQRYHSHLELPLYLGGLQGALEGAVLCPPP